MERSEIKPYIAKRVAKELHDGDVVNLGIGLPTMVPDYLDPSVKLTLQSENGFIGLAAVDPEDPDAAYIVNAGGQPAGIEKTVCSLTVLHLSPSCQWWTCRCYDPWFSSGSEKGNIANWTPWKNGSWMGGAMDL